MPKQKHTGRIVDASFDAKTAQAVLHSWTRAGRKARVYKRALRAAHDSRMMFVVVVMDEPTPPAVSKPFDFKCPSCGSDPDVDCICKPGG